MGQSPTRGASARVDITRRQLVVGAGIAAMAAALSACGATSPTTPAQAPAPSAVQPAATTAPSTASQPAVPAGATKIDFWLLGGAPQATIINNMLVAHYRKTKPDVTVSLQMMASWQDLYQKYLTSMAGGAPPHMGRIKDYWTPQFGVRNGLVPLDKYINASHFDPKRYAPQRWNSTQVQGKTYALPWTVFQHYQFYNEPLLIGAGFKNADGSAKPPATWDDRRAYAKQLTNPSQQQWGNMLYSTDNTEGTTFDWMDLVLQAGGQLMNADRTQFLFNTPEATVPIQYYLDMVYTDKSTIPPGVTVQNGVNGGKVGLWITGPWTIPTMRTQAPNLKFAVVLKPKNKNRSAQLMGNNLTMFAGASHPDATWDFMNFMALPASDLTWNGNAGYLPVQPANWDKPPFSTDPAWKVMTEQARRPDSPTLPIVLDFQEILEGIAAELQVAYLRKKTPKEAVTAAYTKATAILNRSKK